MLGIFDGPPSARALVLILCFLTAAALGQSPANAGGAPATQPALSAHDLELLDHLEAGTWHERKAAEAELADRDPSDEPILRALMARATNPEAKARLAQALATMNSDAALGALRITLHVKDAPADQVYADIFRQARATVKAMPDDLFTHPAIAPLTIDVDRQPFWAVMEQLYPKTGLMVEQLRPGECRLAHADPIPPGPQATQGPILIVATEVQAAVSQALPPTPNPANQAAVMMMMRHRPPRVGFGLVMTAYIEPRIQVLRMTPMIQIEKATDDNGNSLISNFFSRFAGSQAPEPDGGWPQLVARMTYPDSKPGGRIAIFRGTATFDVLLDTGHLQIPSPLTAAPTEFSINEKPVKFLGCKNVGDDYWVRFTCEDGKNDPWSPDVFQSLQRMRFLDADGHELVYSGLPPNTNVVDGTLAQPGTVDHIIVFKPATLPGGRHTGEPFKLDWSYPARTHQIVVPIVFSDVDMNFQGQ